MGMTVPGLSLPAKMGVNQQSCQASDLKQSSTHRAHGLTVNFCQRMTWKQNVLIAFERIKCIHRSWGHNSFLNTFFPESLKQKGQLFVLHVFSLKKHKTHKKKPCYLVYVTSWIWTEKDFSVSL